MTEQSIEINTERLLKDKKPSASTVICVGKTRENALKTTQTEWNKTWSDLPSLVNMSNIWSEVHAHGNHTLAFVMNVIIIRIPRNNASILILASHKIRQSIHARTWDNLW